MHLAETFIQSDAKIFWVYLSNIRVNIVERCYCIPDIDETLTSQTPNADIACIINTRAEAQVLRALWLCIYCTLEEEGIGSVLVLK